MTVTEYRNTIVQFANDTCVAESTRSNYITTMAFYADAVAQYGKDPSLLTRAQLRAYYDERANRASLASIHKTEGVVAAYVEWRRKHGYSYSDVLDEVRLDPAVGVRRTMVSTPLHLQRIMDRVFDPETQDSPDLICRVCLWLAFAGMSVETMATVTSDDVDIFRMRVCAGGVVYPIYREAVWSIWRLSVIGEFIDNRTIAATGKAFVRRDRRQEGNMLLRGSAKKGVSEQQNPDARMQSCIRTLSAKLRRAAKENISADDPYLSTDITLVSVRTSGVFYRQYERELSGLPADLSIDAAMFAEQRSANGRAYSSKGSETRRGQRLRQDYQTWKQVFIHGSGT